MRQTNAVWLLFILGTDWAYQFEQQNNKDRRSTSFALLLIEFIVWIWKNKLQLLTASWAIFVPLLGFAGFVVVNGGIVLGNSSFELEKHDYIYTLFSVCKAIKIITSLLYIQQCFLMPCASVA